MGDTSELDRAHRTNGRERSERTQPLNPWLLLGAGVLVVLLVVLFA